jgi:hypothetical protein
MKSWCGIKVDGKILHKTLSKKAAGRKWIMDEQTEDWKKQLDESNERFLNRPIYLSLSLEIIEATPDSEVEQIVYDNILAKIDPNWDREFEIISQLSDGRKMIYSTWLVEAEVYNGGFNQYYFNSSGIFANMAVWAFNTISAPKLSALVKQANEVFIEHLPVLKKYNDGTLESFSASYDENPLNDLDVEFYRICEEEENMSQLRIAYIRQHPEQFID